MSDKNFYKLSIALAVLGIAMASYLFYNYLTKPAVEVCTISERVNCDAVTKGPLATLFGVPVSLVGFVGYVAVLLFAGLKNKKAVLGTSAFGMLFCLRLTILELFSIKVICPVCLACQLDMLLLFALSILANFAKPQAQVKVE
jgi:uncharacterized membrane protein